MTSKEKFQHLDSVSLTEITGQYVDEEVAEEFDEIVRRLTLAELELALIGRQEIVDEFFARLNNDDEDDGA